MTTLDTVAARLDSLADRFEARANEVTAIMVALGRIEERQAANMATEEAFRAAMAPLPERLARVESQCEANARAIEAIDGRRWDRWIVAIRGMCDMLMGPGGFLRTVHGIALVALVLVGVGVLTVDQLLDLWASVPTLVPVPIPQP